MTYTATDGGGQQTTTNLVINLEDVNDNQPKFELAEYRRVVRESDISFDPPLIIKATDADGPLQGDGKVFYTIQSINTDATVFQVEYRSLFLKLYDGYTEPIRFGFRWTVFGFYWLKAEDPGLMDKIPLFGHRKKERLLQLWVMCTLGKFCDMYLSMIMGRIF